MDTTQRILVTGASGFIGSNILKNLHTRGYRNVVATSFSRSLRDNYDNVEHIVGNLQTAEFCATITQNIDVIIHCAANTTNALDTKVNPLLHVTPNIEMNVNLLEQAWRNSVKKFVFLSSNTVYPDMGTDYCDESLDTRGSDLIPVYKAVGGMKRYTESLCEYFSNQIHNPMQCIIIRPGNSFGPNDKFDYEKCHVTPASIRKVADGLNPIPVWGDGEDVRDILYVEDMADGIVFAAENMHTHDVVNVCYGDGYSINEVLQMVKDIEGNTNPIDYVENKAFMVSIRLLSSLKINQMGWKPKHTVKQGLEKTLEWYKNNKHLFDANSKP